MDLMMLDSFLRGGAVTLLALCALIFAWHAGRGRKHLSVVCACVGVIAYVLVSSPALSVSSPVLVAIAGAVPVLIYWAAIELFQDDVEFAQWQAVLGFVVIASAWGAGFWPVLGMVRAVAVLALLAHILVVVMSGRANDLVDARRRFRVWFVGAILVLAAVITMIEVTHLDRALPLWVFVLHGAAFVILTAAFLIWVLRLDAQIWLMPQARKPEAEITPVQAALVGRIEEAMQDGLWQEEGLSIAGMAQRLDVPEHRLRQAINQTMGHRNFASFVNQYRIAAARDRLADIATADQTVLSIAYEVGFASLGPFNRAFRAQTGMSPTEYRKAALGTG